MFILTGNLVLTPFNNVDPRLGLNDAILIPKKDACTNPKELYCFNRVYLAPQKEHESSVSFKPHVDAFTLAHFNQSCWAL